MVYSFASEWAINSHYDAYLSTNWSPENGAQGPPFGREKRAEQATNYPSQRILQNKLPCGKVRQRYALYLTVYWFQLERISKKTIRNTVSSSGY